MIFRYSHRRAPNQFFNRDISSGANGRKYGNPQPYIRWSLGTASDEERKDYSSHRGQGYKVNWVDVIEAHRDWSGNHGAFMGLYQVFCIHLWLLSWCLCWTLNSGSWGVWVFRLLLGPFSSYWVATPNFDMRFVPSLSVSSFDSLSWYPREARSFLKWNRRRRSSGDWMKEGWEVWRERKLQLKCIEKQK